MVQVNLIITLSLGSMETDCVISESCYNEVIYNILVAKLSFLGVLHFRVILKTTLY